MERIGMALATKPNGMPCEPAVVTPQPVAGLVSKRVLVMDFLKGQPLSRAIELMRERGIDPDGPEAKLFGQRLLSALTEAFGRTILEVAAHSNPSVASPRHSATLLYYSSPIQPTQPIPPQPAPNSTWPLNPTTLRPLCTREVPLLTMWRHGSRRFPPVMYREAFSMRTPIREMCLCSRTGGSG